MRKGEYKKEDKSFAPPICNITTNYCSVFENMGEGVSIFEIIWDEDGEVSNLQVNYINPASILNQLKSREEIVGKTITGLYGAKEAALYLKMANKVISTGKGTRYETYFAQFNKHFLINAFSPHKNIFITVDVDVTREKEVEGQLKESEVRYRNIFENTGIAFMIIEEDMTISLINGEVEKTFGYPKEEVEGKKKWTEFVAREDDRDMMEKYHELRRENLEAAPKEYEFHAIAKNKEIRNVLVTVSMIPGTKRSIASFLDITDRKRAEEAIKKFGASQSKIAKALKKSEKRLEAIIQGSPVLTFIIDMNHRVLHWNKAIEEYSGVKAEEIVGTKDHWKAFYDEKRPTMADLLVEKDIGGISKWYSGKYTKSKIVDGAYEIEDYFPTMGILPVMGKKGKWLHATVSAIKDNKGHIIGAVEILEDITERKQAEEELQESEKKYRELVENANSIIIKMDKHGCITFFNEFAEKFFGFNKDEIVGKSVIGIIVPETESSGRDLQELINKIINDPEAHIINENENITRSGRKVWVAWTNRGIYNEKGEITGILSVGTDITERKRMEEELRKAHDTLEIKVQERTKELRESNASLKQEIEERKKAEEKISRLADIVESSEDAIISHTFDGIITSWNKGAEDVYGYSAEETIGKHAHTVLNHSQYEKLEANMDKIKKGEKIVHYEAKRLRKYGKEIYVSVNLSPIKNSEGKITGISVIARDVTERKKIEKALKESETKFRELFNKANDMITLAELKEEGLPGKYIEVNDVAIKRLGYSREEFLNMTPADIVPSDESAKFQEDAIKLQKERRATFERVHLTRDGRRIPVEVNIHLFELRGKNVIIAISRDITERKKAEKSLKEQYNFLQDLMDAIPVPVFYKDINYIYRGCNKAFEEFIGLSREKIIGKTQYDIAPKVLADEYHEMDKNLFQNPGTQIYETLVQYADGTMHNVVFNKAIYTDIEGKIIGLIGVILDITELKKAEKELKESEEKFRLLFDKSADMITLNLIEDNDRLGRFIEVNEVGVKRLGYSREEFLNMTPWNIDKGSETPKNVAKLVEKGHLIFESIHVAKDGREIPVEINAHHMDYMGMKVGLAVSRDITDRKKAENALKESELHFKALAENSPDIISRVDKDLRHVYINSAVNIIEENRAKSLTGKTFEEVGIDKENPEFVKLWNEKIKKVFNRGESEELEFETPTLEGMKSYESYLVPEYSIKGEIETVLGVSRDITERKQAEIKLKELVEELKRSNSELQQFAYITSHDLQEPLRTIASFTQLIERRYKGQLDPDADEYIDFIVDSAKRMREMIQGLLDYSRVGTKRGRMELTDTEEVLKTVLSNLHAAIEENNAEITHVLLPTIIADRSQLIQLFQNLIGNAIKFRKHGIPPKIHISARKDERNNEYIFGVSDNGIGLEPQYGGKIFEVFKRLHTIDKYKGAGIGLAISKRIIERHGGRIWVESKFREGSTFYFTVPIRIEKSL